ncbi:hypothetical protein OPT61_g2948 [Boeremia exigua]|uniref:Uncharacterized protein n=1 Tax=Boeremia exigua TaxID=749465 RepID=A0ACC2IJT3_9PLEO|nr:hypothetical protein OPT61_g2948 [Boeremia exigua]
MQPSAASQLAVSRPASSVPLPKRARTPREGFKRAMGLRYRLKRWTAFKRVSSVNQAATVRAVEPSRPANFGFNCRQSNKALTGSHKSTALHNTQHAVREHSQRTCAELTRTTGSDVAVQPPLNVDAPATMPNEHTTMTLLKEAFGVSAMQQMLMGGPFHNRLVSKALTIVPTPVAGKYETSSTHQSSAANLFQRADDPKTHRVEPAPTISIVGLTVR